MYVEVSTARVKHSTLRTERQNEETWLTAESTASKVIWGRKCGYVTGVRWQMVDIFSVHGMSLLVGKKLRLNLLCFLGALVGIASLCTSWTRLEVQLILSLRTLAIIHSSGIGLAGGLSSLTDPLRLSAIFFLVGTAVAFITPSGGFFQLGGLLFLLDYSVGEMPSKTHLDTGVILAMISTAVVLASLLPPLGSLKRGNEKRLLARLLTTSRISERLSVNMLSMIGGLVGIACLFLPWASESVPSVNVLGVNYLSPGRWFLMGVDDLPLRISMAVFLAGCVLAFLSPSGGAIQLVGGILFLTYIRDWLVGSYAGRVDYAWVLALAAGCITLAGFVRPTGFGFLKSKCSLVERLLAWGVPRSRTPNPVNT